MTNKKITIYDVATEAGVSLATVSRVINGSSVVKEKTKNRVLQAIEALDFKPNQVARGLATSKTTTIAVVFPQDMLELIRQMMNGIGDASRILDYNICMFTTNDLGEGVETIQNIMEKVIQSRADGVILFQNMYVKEEIDILEKYKLPFVVIGSEYESDHAASIYVDTKSLGKEIVQSYIDKGITNILTCIQDTILLDSKVFVEGIKEAYASKNIEFDDKDVLKVSSDYQECVDDLMNFMAHKSKKYDLVIANYDKSAVAFKNVANDHGIDVPNDIEIIGMMDTNYALMCRPSISSYHFPVYDMGAMALRLLTKILNNEEIDTKKVCVKSTFIKRDSTK